MSVDSGTIVLAVSGMTCGGCAKSVTRVLAKVPGVAKVDVDFGTGRAVVVGDARPDDLVAAVQGAGYEARPDWEAAE